MPRPKQIPKWTPVENEEAALKLMGGVHPPGGLLPVSVDDIPSNLKTMPEITNYYVSAYGGPQFADQNPALCGEFAVTRKDGDLSKSYTYVYAITGDGKVYSNGPCINFPLHHSPSASPITVEDLFGHHPLLKKKG